MKQKDRQGESKGLGTCLIGLMAMIAVVTLGPRWRRSGECRHDC